MQIKLQTAPPPPLLPPCVTREQRHRVVIGSWTIFGENFVSLRGEIKKKLTATAWIVSKAKERIKMAIPELTLKLATAAAAPVPPTKSSTEAFTSEWAL
jgi:hypothetical protein